MLLLSSSHVWAQDICAGGHLGHQQLRSVGVSDSDQSHEAVLSSEHRCLTNFLFIPEALNWGSSWPRRLSQSCRTTPLSPPMTHPPTDSSTSSRRTLRESSIVLLTNWILTASSAVIGWNYVSCYLREWALCPSRPHVFDLNCENASATSVWKATVGGHFQIKVLFVTDHWHRSSFDSISYGRVLLMGKRAGIGEKRHIPHTWKDIY